MRARYTPTTPAERKELEALVADQMEDFAQSAADHAASIAPFDTGAYRSRFRVEQVDGEPRVVNDDPGAVAIEYGTEDTPAHNVMSKTADWLEGSD